MATITTVQTSSRRCSYCRENGHNIRSCEKRILQEKELMKSLRKKENENKPTKKGKTDKALKKAEKEEKKLLSSSVLSFVFLQK